MSLYFMCSSNVYYRSFVDRMILVTWRGEMKSELMPLELFVLLCTKIGITTPYQFMTEAGVGVGASSPTLKRLKQKGLLASSIGPRNRVSYSITVEGETLLRSTLQAGPDAYGQPTARGIYDSLHRVIFFAWIKGRPDEARGVLASAAIALMKRVIRMEREAWEYRTSWTQVFDQLKRREFRGRAPGSRELIAVYRYLESVSDAAEAKLQVEALGKLSQLIDELPASPPIFDFADRDS
jgi:DNA-binding PadR family transcriptional regulator